jgi:hypothetical protein
MELCAHEFLGIYSLIPHRCTHEVSGYEAEYVWGVCEDLNPTKFSDWNTVDEIQNIKVVTYPCVQRWTFSDFWVPISAVYQPVKVHVKVYEHTRSHLMILFG